MISFRIQGGTKLHGEIVPQGAKNEALQILCAVLLTEDAVEINNIPDIRDVNKLIELLGDMGVEVTRLGVGSFRFKATEVNLAYMETEDFTQKASSIRGSVMILGPLLARYGKAALPKPGGDKIGRRRLDTHFLGLEKLGAKFNYDADKKFFYIDGHQLKGTYILLDEASVTGTANVVMGAVMATGTTSLFNAACEPYLQQLCEMLVRMGAKISGIGSNLLTIEGVTKLGGTEHTMLPDMIEIGSFIGMAAITNSDLTIKNVQVPKLGIIPAVFKKLGINMEILGDDIRVFNNEHYEIDTFIDGSTLTVSDAPWPGFTPDLLSIVLVTATQAKGTVLIHQKMFESRLFFVDKLIEMGAQIILCDPHRATVIGSGRSTKLRGIRMSSPDIRAGVSLLLAAMAAEGESIIDHVEQIDRGYQNIDGRLNALGAKITRLN
jgi:UDP-N-acetylglucosamine 1-carboxyvinyltransferase